MKEFRDKLAVVTGGGSGMGRELARQLSAEGCHVALCDVSSEDMADTKRLCETKAPQDTRLSVHLCDVSDQAQVNGFRDGVLAEHETDHVDLLFNNAGIGGGGSFVDGEREEWERTFGVCWFGVYYCCRAFVPLLIASEAGHLINTSSVNGFWASLGPGVPHTAYSAAKFAVKGFTEALINDLRLNAPHVRVSVVMPGHIGTSIGINTNKVLGKSAPLSMSAEEVAEVRKRLLQQGLPIGNETDDHIRKAMHQRSIDFRDKAPMSAAEAAMIILDGVREERWRILVGADAAVLDGMVRESPDRAYEPEFIEEVRAQGHLRGLMDSDE